MTIAPAPDLLGERLPRPINPLQFTRTCYNHLAGTLAVKINDSLQQCGLLVPERNGGYHATEDGRLWFEEFGLDLTQIKSRSGVFARQCLDWTERRHHLAGALGTALLQRLFELKWLVRGNHSRAVRLTRTGQEQLGKLLGADFNT